MHRESGDCRFDPDRDNESNIKLKMCNKKNNENSCRVGYYIALTALAIAIFRIFYTGSLIELAKSIWHRL